MELTKDDKDELRHLIQEEIYKAFDVAINAAQKRPLQIYEIHSNELQQQRTEQNKSIAQIGNAVLSALQDLVTERRATIIEKTDPQRADIIRRTKGEF